MKGTITVLVVLVVTALSGCTDDAAETPTVEPDGGFQISTEDGLRDLREDLTIDDAAPAPEWKVGDWWGHHFFFGSEDTAGSHINTVIVEDRGNDWFLATDDSEVAMWESTWDFPMLGTLSKSDLSTTAFDLPWQLYQFPMSHGDTWDFEVSTLSAAGNLQATIEAVYNPSIATPYGNKPGFDLIGTNSDGVVVVESDYVPAIGWYSQLTVYDPTTEDPEDFAIRILSMGFGEDFEGVYYVHEAEQKIYDFWYVTPFDASNSSPPHSESFTIGDSSDTVYGAILVIAGGGTSMAGLVDPNGEAETWQVQHLENDEEGAGAFGWIEAASVPGDWNFGWAGAGAFSAAFVAIWEITEHTFIFEPSATA